ncbi:glycine cleavage system aminomethyltransferase GcvT [Leptospira ellisii]|uniref:Aminomethyltransferase n=1 Tax=Leptospira ellisii TaxID=2023197 RepID=A0A2N0B5Z2_9LEPT|nr:glycine cleavage system aminomethyltransferase GcvT [Leptospira ellisii]MDV6234268.1 glycine cleavage system aminomethyltransferase GcvT [Leptospira ellisii]PJZ91967.1 glycine cleavage system protein T [Leptospira ellisii]PKA05299.1 glycine cleavage system protein T [Leptospira ellisii]
MSQDRKTPLNETHRTLGAKMIPFGGWDMPVQYSGIIAEHTATREAAGLFDVSHMGEIFVTGEPESILQFLESLSCNTVSSLENFQVQYNAILNEQGGLVDDVTIYKFSPEKYMICSNASNYEAVAAHLKKHLPENGVTVDDQSSRWHQIALQGPKADQILSQYLSKDLSGILYYRFAVLSWEGEEILVSRTGYTGEDGFEIYSSVPLGLKLWNGLLEFGKPFGLIPCGLGARDTLRIEAKYALYGHELSEVWTPVESGIGWIVKEKEKPYFASDKILSQKKGGPSSKIVGFCLTEAGVPRENFRVLDADGNEIGKTTSGTFSPSLKKGIGLALIRAEKIKDGEPIQIEIREQPKQAIIVTKPFIEGSIRKN